MDYYFGNLIAFGVVGLLLWFAWYAGDQHGYVRRQIDEEKKGKSGSPQDRPGKEDDAS